MSMRQARKWMGGECCVGGQSLQALLYCHGLSVSKQYPHCLLYVHLPLVAANVSCFTSPVGGQSHLVGLQDTQWRAHMMATQDLFRHEPELETYLGNMKVMFPTGPVLKVFSLDDKTNHTMTAGRRP